MRREVVLAGACRTAIGKFGGALSGVPAAKLGSVVIGESLWRAGIAPEQVDEVLMGCVLQAGQGQNLARQAAVGAGLPVEVPATTINTVCASGLKSVLLAAQMVAAGDADIVVAGGMESMSRAPYLLPGARDGYRLNHARVMDSVIQDGLWDAFHDYHMGITAENLAEKYGITREMQDEYAAMSQQRCERAMGAGKFEEEIVPVEVAWKHQKVPFARDESPRAGVTAQSLANLRCSFKSDGTVTAGNASSLNDGAAAVVVMGADIARRLGIEPMARWLGGAMAGVDPSIMGIGPACSTAKALERCGLSLGDINLVEANEAFAAQSLAVQKELGWDMERVNVNGGAIALGHPIGASGCRILVTLLYEMNRRRAQRGLATLCVGGGMGITGIVERMG